MTPTAPTRRRSALLALVAAPVNVATAAGFVVVPAPAGEVVDDGATGWPLWNSGLPALPVVGLTWTFVVVAVAVAVAVAVMAVQGMLIVQGQSVMVNVVASVTVKVLVPCVNCVGNGQKVVYRVTTVVVYDVESLVEVDLVP
jgi:hypothetical protein